MAGSTHHGGAHDRRRRTRSTAAAILAAGMAVAIFAMSSVPGSGLPPNLGFWTTVAHFSEFAVFGALIAAALDFKIDKTLAVALVALAIASAYGASDEFHQSFVPGRFVDAFDWLADTCGAAVGAFLSAFLLARLDAKKMSSKE